MATRIAEPKAPIRSMASGSQRKPQLLTAKNSQNRKHPKSTHLSRTASTSQLQPAKGSCANNEFFQNLFPTVGRPRTRQISDRVRSHIRRRTRSNCAAADRSKPVAAVSDLVISKRVLARSVRRPRYLRRAKTAARTRSARPYSCVPRTCRLSFERFPRLHERCESHSASARNGRKTQR